MRTYIHFKVCGRKTSGAEFVEQGNMRNWVKWRQCSGARREKASKAANARWARARAARAGEPIRQDRVLLRLSVQRPGVDPRPVALSIGTDGGYARRTVREDGIRWRRNVGRAALLHWFEGLLKSGGV